MSDPTTALRTIQQTEETIVGRGHARTATAAAGVAADLRTAAAAACDRIELASQEDARYLAAHIAGVLAECLLEMEARALACAAVETIEHVPAALPEREAMPMASAAQETASAAPQLVSPDVPSAPTDDGSLLEWVEQQRNAGVSWPDIAAALVASGREATADSIRMRYNRWRKVD